MAKSNFTVVNIGTLSMNKFWDETERLRPAHSTCTLLETSDRRLLVDPSPEPEALERKLFDTTGLKPDQIDQVFATHAHADHYFGIELFASKECLMASAELEGWKVKATDDVALAERFGPAEGRLPEGIDLFASPGHTHQTHSLSTEIPWGRLFVTGDAVMTQDFLKAGEGFHNSVDFAAAADTIARIKEAADIVIPGHGNYFLNK